ncbi:MAG: hypothetical protein AABW89_00175 [Nanoarchaeota archaeon]
MDYLDLRPHEIGDYVEAIKDGEIIRVPERVALLEDLFILRKISKGSQVSQNIPVAPSNSSKNLRESARNSTIMFDWKHGKFGGKKNNVTQDLVSNFNWEISRNRKIKNMSRAKLAQMINSTEEDVKMIELGELPKDDFVLISRIENVFGINLRKYPASIAQVNLEDLKKNNEQRKKEEEKKVSKDIFKDSTSFAGNDIEILD